MMQVVTPPSQMQYALHTFSDKVGRTRFAPRTTGCGTSWRVYSTMKPTNIVCEMALQRLIFPRDVGQLLGPCWHA